VNEILRFARLEGGHEQVLDIWALLIALGLTYICSICIGLVYRYTHRSPGYSQSYVQTLVLTSLVTALIMLVIGSNLARAFSLVGALSIIRFRNAIKETRDVGYIFFSMAVAMAAGTQFFTVALLATGVICASMLSLHFLNFGAAQKEAERLLRVRLPVDSDPTSTVEKVMQEVFLSFSLVLCETVKQGLQVELLYSVKPRPDVPPTEVLKKLSASNENLKVVYHYNSHSEEP
jgi:uncharacterized membrane protein YhiD involved in acid resistance